MVHIGSETVTINNAAGRLIYVYVSGAVAGGLYYIDFWSTDITKIAGSSMVESYVTMSKVANSSSITFTNTSSGCDYTLIK